MRNYVLGEQLGARVFAGHAHGPDGEQPVAMRRVPANDTARLVTETRRLVGMLHSNLVGVIDLVRDGDDVFLVTEYVEGVPLRQVFDARGSLSFGLATYVVDEVARGLAFAHSRGIVHGDVRAEHVLVGRTGEVRVARFGIAPHEGELGADIRALGAVLYELVTGVRPTLPCTVPPADYNPDIPAELDALCTRALANRFASVQVLREAIGELRRAQAWDDGAPALAALAEATARSGHEGPTLVTASMIVDEPRSDLASVRGGLAPPPVTATITLDERDLIPMSAPVERVWSPPPVRAARTHVIAVPERRRRWLSFGVLPLVFGLVVGVCVKQQGTPSPVAEPVVVIKPAPTLREPFVPDVVDDLVEIAYDAEAAYVPLADPTEPFVAITAVVQAVRPVAPRRSARRGRAVARPTATGTLRVETDDGGLARVSLAGERKQAPGARFQHAVGKAIVVLEDDEGHRQSCTVTIEPRTRTLTVSMQTGACRLR